MNTNPIKIHSLPKLGLDFGKVIMGATSNGVADTSFLGTGFNEAMNSPATSGAIDDVTALVEVFDGQVWIVSKCGKSVENKTRGWLRHHNFYTTTGLKRESVLFCRKRPEKAPVCEKIGITHFVEDRIDVLHHMVGIVPNLFLFGEQSPEFTCPDFVTPALTWKDVLHEITISTPG